MKSRRKYAALLAAVIIATSIPVLAASSNRVSKFVSVAKDATLERTLAPELIIELNDELEKNQTFYLNLENAEWIRDIEMQLGIDPNFTFIRESKTQLAVVAKKNLLTNQSIYRIPMLVKVTGKEATVEIKSNDTVVTNGKYTFARSNDSKSNITVDSIEAFASVGKMGEITIEEQYIGAFQSSDTQTLIVKLRSKGIEFNYNQGTVIKEGLIGKKAYLGQKYDVKVINGTTLEVKIPANSLQVNQRGAFEFKDLEIRAGKEAVFGDIRAVIEGDFAEPVEITVAKYSDYGTELKAAKEYTVTAGQKLKDIEFTLSEIVPHSLRETRETIFIFPEGVTIDNVAISKSEGIKKAPALTIEQKNNQNLNIFTMKSIVANNDEKISITFKATLNVPTTLTKNINLVAEGTSIEERKEILIAKVEEPVNVGIEPAMVKVGLAKQQGGKITIRETAEGNISKGKIFLALEESTMVYTEAPEVKVTKGDLRIDGGVEIVKGGFEITIKGQSTQPSTLEISGGEIKVDRTVPAGSFSVQVGGPALSAYSADTLWNTVEQKYNDIDPILEADFIIVRLPNLIGAGKVENTASFKIGQMKYIVNGEEKTMDTAAYLAKEGRTMIPVRYVADALGVNPNQILWDGESKTVIILADRVVQIELGSREMVINGAKVSMTAASEMKNSRVFIPVAEVARVLDTNVEWHAATQTVTFN